MSKPFVYKLIKKNGRLVFKNNSDLKTFQELTDKLREGTVIEQMTIFDRDDGSLSQIAKVKAMIRELAKEIGDTFLNTEVAVKKECGLIDLKGDVRSFGDCSKEELSDVIQHLIQRGKWIGINLNR